MAELIDLTGRRYGRLTVLRKADKSEYKKVKNRAAQWLCGCDCGKEIVAGTGNLNSGNTKSCGCYKYDRQRQRRKPYSYETRLYNIWGNMKQRCTNPKNKSYRFYGAVGIGICDEWMNDYYPFYQWAMENGYADELTLDRIDSTGDYCPENCRWITIQEQQNNRRDNRKYTYEGDTHSISEWSRIVGIGEATIRHRLNVGWDIKSALCTPPKYTPSKKKAS